MAGINKNDPRYYQQHGDTTYYVIPTKQLPLLKPLNGLLPKPVLAKVDAPLRRVVELGYDRSDYSKSVTATAVPPKKTAKPARTSLPDRLRQSTAAISSTLRSITGRKSDPEPEKQQPKPSDSAADKSDAA